MNGCTGGALLPMLTLGIPGDAVTAIMLGALTLQGMQPGPLMFTDHGDMVYTLFVGMIFCYFMLLVLGLLSLKVIGNVVKIPGNILTPMILALCVVGTYALNNSLFDVGIMLIACGRLFHAERRISGITRSAGIDYGANGGK